MKTKITFIILVLLLISCTKKEDTNSFQFESFTFSYAGLNHDNSIKFTKSDTVYFQKKYPEPKENFYAILKKNERNELNKLIRQLDYKIYDSIYAENNLQDGQSYLLNFSKDKTNKWIFIYGDNAPEKIYAFIKSLGEFKTKLKFIPTKKNINFGYLKYNLSPPPPPPLKIDSLK
ncbi:hypothetical protein [Flavobacterium eburneipallidum]|uniref:hypothetical protein n=1 Tax=Flavobacterium eburneipallidum TaxID=3003263 RepID=UPI0024824E71|nr:hypothetical protein [Flavobacterium eburneipallidum]